MEPLIEVDINDTQGSLRVDHAALDTLVRVVMGGLERARASISIALVDNAAIHAVNRTHLGHDWPTDVISFPLNDPDDPVLSGELVVSVEMACASARELGVEPLDELSLYVVHGLLHLCGYDDLTDADRRLMRERETELLTRAGLINPFDRAEQAEHGGEGVEGPWSIDLDVATSRAAGHQPEGRSWTG
jgi:probable rRNA maturation factor